MKKMIYSIFLLASTLGIAQSVGINTDSPEVLLHITDFDTNEDGVIETPRVEVGLKIPTHTSFPNVPFSTDEEKTLSKAKNGMLIHFNRPATTDKKALQGFYYWDDNAYSWQNIIDSRDVNLDTSKLVAIGGELTANIVGASTAKVVFSTIKTFDDNFELDSNTNEIIIGKPANYYLLLTGSVEKGGNSQPAQFTAKINKNGNTIIESSVSLAANTTEYRTANFYISKILSFDKNDRISVSITGSSAIVSGYVKSPFALTLIKLD